LWPRRIAGRPARRQCEVLRAQLAYGTLDEVLSMGLRQYLERFLADNNALGFALHAGFMEMN